jgi:spore coat polysaccharide biosynthesis predicted glycosyltransferase SpsG
MILNDKKNILICPLEWGLGHAGRMVPLAKRLLQLNHNIFFGSGEEHLDFLKKEIPEATFINFPGFRINYSRYIAQYIIILLKSPLLLYHIFHEHNTLKRIIKDYSIDIVISDNRIGLWNSEIKTVFVTHQLRIPFPKPFRFLEFIGIQITRSIIRRYSCCFVPDLNGELNVSGRLSHGFRLPVNVRYIGILSRFSDQNNDVNSISGKCTAILSGPEPQRTILQQKLIKILISTGKPAIILEGKPGKVFKSYCLNNIVCYNHLPDNETIKLLKESDTIITRSGYTTIMELISLGRNALLIPTPGQTEQEYLAEYLSQKGWFTFVTQRDLDENNLISSQRIIIPGEFIEESGRLLDTALKELLEE